MQKIKVNDEVIVLTGKDKGKTGKVTKILEQRVVVSGINMCKKHVKPNPNKGVDGGIVAKEMSLHISNVALYNAATKKADRVGFKMNDGKNVRFFKSNNELVDA